MSDISSKSHFYGNSGCQTRVRTDVKKKSLPRHILEAQVVTLWPQDRFLGPTWGPFYLCPIFGPLCLFGAHWDPFGGRVDLIGPFWHVETYFGLFWCIWAMCAQLLFTCVRPSISSQNCLLQQGILLKINHI